MRLLLLPVGLRVGRVNEELTRTAPAARAVGRLRYSAGRPDDAIPLFERAIAAAEAYRPLGKGLLEEILVNSRVDLVNCHLETGHPGLARRAAEDFLRAGPDAAGAYVGAMRADPENPAWLLARAAILDGHLGRRAEAMKLRERAERMK